MKKPKDESVLEAEAVEASHGPGASSEPAVSLMMKASPVPYEVIITADEMRAMLEECDPE